GGRSWWGRGRRGGLDFAWPTPVSGGAQNVQAAIECHLIDLSVGKPCAEAAPVYAQISANINTIVCSDIKRARRGDVVDLNRPDRQIGKGAAQCAADVRPIRAAIGSPENMTPSAKPVDHGVRDLGVGGIDPDIIDSGAARRQIELSPNRPMVGSNEDLAGRSKCSASGSIDCIDIRRSNSDCIYIMSATVKSANRRCGDG